LLFGNVRPFIGKLSGYDSNKLRYANADLIISTGGTYLVEHYDLKERFVQLWLALETPARVVLFTQSLGPFRRALNKSWMRSIARRAQLIMLRDALSAEHLQQIGARTESVLVTADAAFALADPAKIVEAATRKRKPHLHVGISVRFWKHYRSGDHDVQFAAYLSGVAALIERLITTRGADITLISTCQGVSEYANDDSLCAERVRDLVRAEHRSKVSVDKDFHTPFELMGILSTFDMVVATRMHMAILAMCVGVPVLPIAYEFKTRELFKKLGLERWVTDIEECSADLLPRLGEQFAECLDDVRQRLSVAIPQEQKTAFQIVDRLKGIMNTR
jgi:colanic acid/amylovoran biosynthesis protein